MLAFVDESHRRRLDGSGSYFLAAVLVHPRQVDVVRQHVVRSLPKGLVRYHFGVDQERHRFAALKCLAGADVRGATVHRSDAPSRKAERARVLSMWVLFDYLVRRGVERVFLENRTKSLNRRDHKTIAHIRKDWPATARVSYEFVLPSEEALVWLPDILAGAVGHDLHEGVRHYRTELPEQLHEVLRA